MILNKTVGKREEKKAIQKLAIMTGFLEAMVSSELHQLKIEDVCKTIGTSKVTFFNYFDSKEQVVEYFIQLWQYDLSYTLDKRELIGSKLIFAIFDHVSEHPAAQQIMNALMGFFIKNDCYEANRISDYEFYLYNEDAYTKGYRGTSLNTLIEKGLIEQNLEEAEKKVMVNIIISGFYGIAFNQNLGLGSDLKSSYHQFLRRVL